MNKVLGLVLCLLCADRAWAGDLGLECGERVRARLANGGVITGTLTGATDTSLQITTKARFDRELPMRAIVRLDRSLGLKRQTLPGAAWGAAFGGVLALVYMPYEDYVAAVGVRTVPLFAVLGGAIGSAVQREAWQPVDLGGVKEDKLRVSLSVQPAGAGLSSGVAVSW